MKILVCLSGALICLVCCSYGQVDSTAMMLAKFPNRIFAKINSKASSLDDALTKQTEKYLQRLARKGKKDPGTICINWIRTLLKIYSTEHRQSTRHWRAA